MTGTETYLVAVSSPNPEHGKRMVEMLHKFLDDANVNALVVNAYGQQAVTMAVIAMQNRKDCLMTEVGKDYAERLAEKMAK